MHTCRQGSHCGSIGSAGGVGIAAIEVGKLVGTKVNAVASTAGKRNVCLRAGAPMAIGYDGIRKRCKELTDQHGIDVVLDLVGGAGTEMAFRTPGWRGRLVVVGFASGTVPGVPVNLALLKERTITGVYLGGSVDEDSTGNADNYELLKT